MCLSGGPNKPKQATRFRGFWKVSLSSPKTCIKSERHAQVLVSDRQGYPKCEQQKLWTQQRLTRPFAETNNFKCRSCPNFSNDICHLPLAKGIHWENLWILVQKKSKGAAQLEVLTSTRRQALAAGPLLLSPGLASGGSVLLGGRRGG